MSFLKFIEQVDTDIPETWRNDIDAAYRHAKPADKAAFVLGQSIALHYLTTLCGGDDKLPILIKEYKDRVIHWMLPDLKAVYYVAKDKQDPYVKLAYLNIEILLGLSQNKLSAKECIQVLNAGEFNVPHAIDATFYAPYLTFIEKTFGCSNEVNENLSTIRSFRFDSAVSIPTFTFKSRVLMSSNEIILPSYQFDYKKIGTLASMVGYNSIWSYWAGYNWRGKSVSGVIGVLAAQCLEKDANAITKGSNLLGFLDIYHQVIPTTQSLDQSNSLALSSDTTIQRRNIVSFLIYLREHYDVLFDDSSMLAQYAAGLDKNDGATLHDFLVAESPKDVSVEMYDVFKKSCFRNFSELDVVINGRTGRTNQSGSLDAKENSQDDPDAQQANADDSEAQGEDDDPKSKKKKEKSDKQTPEETAPESTSSTGTKTTDEKQSADAEDGTQDTPDDADDDNSNSTDSPSDPGTKPDEELKNPDESSATDEQQADTHTHYTKIPAVPKLDDKRGVKLSLSEGESTNTVLYRKELEAYIDSLLANPPSTLSVQSIAAIKRLKAHWLYLLSVKNLHDFLAAMVKLPQSITLKK